MDAENFAKTNFYKKSIFYTFFKCHMHNFRWHYIILSRGNALLKNKFNIHMILLTTK